MHETVLVGTRLTPEQAEAFAGVARLHGRSVAAELRLICADHMARSVEAFEEATPGDESPRRREQPPETAAHAGPN